MPTVSPEYPLLRGLNIFVLFIALFLVGIGLLVLHFKLTGMLIEQGRMRWYLWLLSFSLLAGAIWLAWLGFRYVSDFGD